MSDQDIGGGCVIKTEAPVEVQMTLGPLSVLRQYQRGDVVFVELSKNFSEAARNYIADCFREVNKATGVYVVILDVGMKVVGKPTEADER
jgi:hypothetical protein